MRLIIQPLILLLLLANQSFADKWLDPMEPPAYAKYKYKLQKIKKAPLVQKTKTAEKKKDMVLQSILYSKNRKVAIINGKALSIGDSVDNAKIIYISKNEVKLVQKGKVIVLGVNPTQSIIKITQKSGKK